MAGTVLVTGGTGYIATYLIRQLLDEGWTVHTTIRSLIRETDLRKRFIVDETRLKVFQADLMNDAGWAEACAGCTHIAHVASPIPASAPKDENDLIVPAREGALRALKFGKAAGVKRVVLTSSMAAIGYGVDRGEHHFDESNWTDINHPDAYPYVKSKTIAERAARDWMAENGGDMEFCTVNPGMVLGPVTDPDFSASVEVIKQLLDGSLPAAPDMGFPIVDVRDVADLHVRALTATDMNGERFLAAGKFMKFIEIAAVLRDRMAQKARKAPTRKMPDFILKVLSLFNSEIRGVLGELGKVRHADSSHAKDKLGWTMRPEEDSIVETAESLIAHGVVKV